MATERTPPARGSFPFPLEESGRLGKETAYLDWIREHSSYLTARGVLAFLTGAGNLLAGVIKNAIVIAPFLLLGSLLLGYFHFVLLDHSLAFFFITPFVFFPLTYLIISNQHDHLRGTAMLGRLILGFCLSGAVLLIPWSVEGVRDSLRSVNYNWNTLVFSFFGAVASLTAFQQFIPIQYAWRRSVLFFCFGFVGFGLLFVSVLLLVDFVVYGQAIQALQLLPTWMSFNTVEIAVVVAFGLGIPAGLFSIWRRWRRQDRGDLLASLSLSLVPILSLLLLTLSVAGLSTQVETMRLRVGELSRPLFALISKPLKIETVPHEYRKMWMELKAQAENLNDFVETLRVEEAVPRRPLFLPESARNLVTISSGEDEKRESRNASEDKNNPTRWQNKYFSMAVKFVDRAQELVEGDDLSIYKLRQEIAKMDRQGLLDLAKVKIEGAPGWSQTNSTGVPDSRKQGELSLQELCANEVLFRISMRLGGQLSSKLDLPDSAAFENHVVALTGDQMLSHIILTLQAMYPNARHQHEFARLVGREKEIPNLAITQRRTTSAQGSIPFLSGEPVNEHQKVAIRTGLLAGCLDAISDQDISVAEAYSNELASDDWGKLQIAAHLETRDHRRRRVEELHESAKSSPKARGVIIDRALDPFSAENAEALDALAELSIPTVRSEEDLATRQATYAMRLASRFNSDELIRLAMAKFTVQTQETPYFYPADRAVVMVATGRLGDLEGLKELRRNLAEQSFPVKRWIYLALAGCFAMIGCWLIDINATSLHGYYRDSLCNTFLLAWDPDKRAVRPRPDLRLSDLSTMDSIGPYHLINSAINLQGSSDLGLRDRKSDFFLFSALYCGCERTGYATTHEMESSQGALTLGTAIAISAGAVSPNMGRMTNAFSVMMMTLLNLRLGYWVPNPKSIGNEQDSFEQVFQREISSKVVQRWTNAYADSTERSRYLPLRVEPSTGLNLVGLACSGGGIRSATVNLGVLQALSHVGIFRHVDFISTVSGGGYVGASVSAIMRTSRADSQSEYERGHRRIPPCTYFGREMVSRLNEKSGWVNISDGGHIENLGVIELLRRSCKFIIVGDGEADPNLQFGSLGTLFRLARLELGIEFELDLKQVREDGTKCKSHWAIGRIIYPNDVDCGYLLYLKSSLTGDESEIIKEYKARNPKFPHQPTTDQFFNLGQFEAYRSLGVHMGMTAARYLEAAQGSNQGSSLQLASDSELKDSLSSFDTFRSAFRSLWDRCGTISREAELG